MGSGSAGFLDTLGEAMGGQSGRSRSTHRRTKKRRSHSRSRSRSRSSSHRRGSKSFAGGFFGAADSNYNKHNSSKSSFFGLPNISRSSMFGTSKDPIVLSIALFLTATISIALHRTFIWLQQLTMSSLF